jgi:deoxyribodipyrimidine photo-lyase
MARKTVVYWVSRALRVLENPVLLEGQKYALEHQCDYIAAYFLEPDLPYANLRNMDFLLRGLVEMADKLKRYHIPLILVEGDAEECFGKLCETRNVAAIFGEYQVLKPWMNTQDRVRALCAERDIRFQTLDAACVVPVEVASAKLEYAARTFRPKIMAKYKDYLGQIDGIIHHPQVLNEIIFDRDAYLGIITNNPQWNVVTPSPLVPGEDAANLRLNRFIVEGLDHYDRRNEYHAGGQSMLSAYLRFGMISPVKVIRDVEASGHRNAALFVEEALVRRELAQNFCHYCKDYDALDGAWAWAKNTLRNHRNDVRAYLYDYLAFESAGTHDELWNFCQRQVVKTGYLHSYLRMYWAKMVLLWTPDAAIAIDYLIRLNDTYFLDGQDPNGYTGILWSVAAVHDRPWFDKPIHGLIRAMGKEGTLRKTKLKVDELKETP